METKISKIYKHQCHEIINVVSGDELCAFRFPLFYINGRRNLVFVALSRISLLFGPFQQMSVIESKLLYSHWKSTSRTSDYTNRAPRIAMLVGLPTYLVQTEIWEKYLMNCLKLLFGSPAINLRVPQSFPSL